MTQDEDEPVHNFETRLQPEARRTCSKKCVQNVIHSNVAFTEQMVRDHIIRGLADDEIKKKVLALEWKQYSPWMYILDKKEWRDGNFEIFV